MPLFNFLGKHYLELLEKVLFFAPNICWQSSKTCLFRFYLLGTFGDALIFVFDEEFRYE